VEPSHIPATNQVVRDFNLAIGAQRSMIEVPGGPVFNRKTETSRGNASSRRRSHFYGQPRTHFDAMRLMVCDSPPGRGGPGGLPTPTTNLLATVRQASWHPKPPPYHRDHASRRSPGKFG